MSVRRSLFLVVLAGLTACTSGGAEPDPPAGSPAPTGPAATLAATTTAYADQLDLARDSHLTGPVGLADLGGSALPGHRALDPVAASLRGPHFDWRVPAVAEVTGPLPERLATALGLPAGAVPAAGHALLVVELAGDQGPTSRGDGDPEPTLTVTTGADSRRVRLPRSATGAGILAVSVRAGGHPVLRVTDAGRTQSLDLVTGRRGRDAIAAYHPVVAGTSPADPTRVTTLRLSGPGVAGYGPADREATVGLGDVDVRLAPYVRGWGWAKPGRAWLEVAVGLPYDRPGMVEYWPDTVTVPPSCFRVTDDRGRPVPLSGHPATISGPEGGGIELFSDVPDSLRAVTVAYTFCGSIRAESGPVTYRAEGNPRHTAEVPLT